MADIKISALPGASTLDGTETIPLVQGGTTKKVTSDQFLIKDASGNVGVGTASPTQRIDAVTAGGTCYARTSNGTITSFSGVAASVGGAVYGTGTNHPVVFLSNGTERARIDSAGNLGLGVTPSAWNSAFDVVQMGAGTALTNPNSITQTWLSSNAFYDTGWKYMHSAESSYYQQSLGSHSWFTAPSGTAGNPISFTQAMTLDASGNLTPGGDNTQTLGSGALRWSTVYAGTGTINTSDAREKTDVRVMTADEIEAAKALSKEIGIYQFLDSVAKKGDKARHHVGLTVQRAIELMKLHGLDPFAYGFICFDKWDDVVVEHPAIEAKAATEAKDSVVDDEGNVIEAAVEAQAAIEAKDAWAEVTLKAGDRYSFRYDQLNLFIACGIEARLAALEAK